MSSNLPAHFSELQEKKRRRKFIRFFIVAILLPVYGFSLFVLLIIFRSPLFRIQHFVIQGAASISSDEILNGVRGAAFENRKAKLAFGMNHFWAWPDSLSGKELLLLPTIKEIHIEKQYATHTIVIHVIERESYGIWCFVNPINKLAEKICRWFDGDGTMFRRAPAAEGSLIKIVNDYAESDPGLLNPILPQGFLMNFFSIMSVLQESKLPVTEIRLDDLGLQEIAVQTGGPKIYFSLRFSAKNILSVLQSLTTTTAPQIQYIDFRVENRAYYQ